MTEESFNSDFCNALEVYLLSAMKKCDHKLAFSCWIDGVTMPFIEKQLTKKSVNDTRKIETTVWTLTDKGDILFELFIYFGKYSLRRYAKGTNLKDCLPPLESDHILIDFENERIELHLL
jgi:hypothetical protein